MRNLANIKKEATYRINFCREETKKAIPKLIKKLPEGIVLDEQRIENLTSVFPLQYLSMFAQLSKYKKWNFYYWLLCSNDLKKVFFFHHLIRILVLFTMLKKWKNKNNKKLLKSYTHKKRALASPQSKSGIIPITQPF